MNKFNLILLTLLLTFSLSGCTTTNLPTKPTNTINYSQNLTSPKKLISVKYRSDSVDINSSSFEYLPTSSSVVNGLWYDKKNEYLIILLNSTYYHYCGLSLSEWQSFKKASSYGTYYNQNIKGNYDCRKGYVPSYN